MNKTRSQRRKGSIIIAIVAVVAMLCVGGALLITSPTDSHKPNGPSTTRPPITLSHDWVISYDQAYRGHILHCSAVEVSFTEKYYSCDYVRFYAEHPELLPKPG